MKLVRHWIVPVAVAAAISGSMPGALVAQESVTLVAGDYSAGWLKRLIFGSDYRDLWTTPIRVPVLDIGGIRGRPGHRRSQIADGRSDTRIRPWALGAVLCFREDSGE